MKTYTIEIAKRNGKKFEITETKELTALEILKLRCDTFKEGTKYLQRDGKASVYNDTDRHRVSVEADREIDAVSQELVNRAWDGRDEGATYAQELEKALTNEQAKRVHDATYSEAVKVIGQEKLTRILGYAYTREELAGALAIDENLNSPAGKQFAIGQWDRLAESVSSADMKKAGLYNSLSCRVCLLKACARMWVREHEEAEAFLKDHIQIIGIGRNDKGE